MSRTVLGPQFTARVSSLLVGVAGLFFLLAFISFDPADLPFLTSQPNVPTHNIAGVLGSWAGFIGREGFGWASLMLPALCVVWAAGLWRGHPAGLGWVPRALTSVCLLTSLGTLAALLFGGTNADLQAQLGGAIGYLLVQSGRYYLGPVTTGVLAACLTALAWLLLTNQTGLSDQLTRLVAWVRGRVTPHLKAQEARSAVAGASATEPPSSAERATGQSRLEFEGGRGKPEVRVRSTVVVPKPKMFGSPSAQRPKPSTNGFQLPSLDLLADPPPLSQRQLTENLQLNAKVLEETLRDFGIEARCVNIDRGPAVTRYELAPAPGVKITRIVSLADDLALVLKAASCHIVAPIPGKGLVGVEVPNSTSTTVYLKEILTSREFQGLGSPLAIGVGKDVSGQGVVCDLRDCPHLLVAGATGSGKTVFLNSLLLGMLYQATPEQLKFLMIDPKMVELTLFNDVPHLVAPVVTDAKRAAAALSWAVAEMERRYQQLAKAGVRNIAAYNQRCATIKANGAHAQSEEQNSSTSEPMPYLVIVIDELADLMLVASKDVEEAITRLAQLSRAVGLHVILATQRPSVDVITGVIKANFPARIAFQVASKVDSRTILDANGADKLLGRGDLLFLRPGTAKPIRAQASFVTDAEIERVVSYLTAQRQPTYDEALLARQGKPADAMMGIGDKDELYEMAKKLVLETGQASTSLLQRRLRLGYGRAARILDLMEQEGLVGPPQGSRPREVLVDPQAIENS